MVPLARGLSIVTVADRVPVAPAPSTPTFQTRPLPVGMAPADAELKATFGGRPRTTWASFAASVPLLP